MCPRHRRDGAEDARLIRARITCIEVGRDWPLAATLLNDSIAKLPRMIRVSDQHPLFSKTCFGLLQFCHPPSLGSL
jgi:hypothetical protein